MVTNYPHSMAAGRDITDDAAEASGLGERVLDRLRQTLCGLHGHDAFLQFEQERMFLKCVSCGHETHGWTLNEAPPTVSVRGDARRHVLARARLVSDRKIA
jgi:hypothetical protein